MKKWIILMVLICGFILFSQDTFAPNDWIIDGDIVYIDDENVRLEAEPHTFYSNNPLVTFNLTSKKYTGDIDVIFGFDRELIKPVKAELFNSISKKYEDFSSNFNRIDYNFRDMNIWYYATDLPIVAGKEYSLRVELNAPINTEGKYWFAVKPSSETLQQAISNNHLYYLDPWWNTSFWKKKEILVQENSYKSWNNWTIHLDVDYDPDMNSDFSDLRFLNGSENTELNYYIEDYTASTSASVWVMLEQLSSNLPTTIYMYYNNSKATTIAYEQSHWKKVFIYSFGDNSIDTTLWSPATKDTSGNANVIRIDEINPRLEMEITDDGSGSGLKVNMSSLPTQNITDFWMINFTTPVCEGYGQNPDDISTARLKIINALSSTSPLCSFTFYDITGNKYVNWNNTEWSIVMNGSSAGTKNYVLYSYNGTPPELNVHSICTGVSSTVDLGLFFELDIQSQTTWASARMYVEDLRIRKFNQTEPTVTFGDEQGLSPIKTLFYSPNPNNNTWINTDTTLKFNSTSDNYNITYWIFASINLSNLTIADYGSGYYSIINTNSSIESATPVYFYFDVEDNQTWYYNVKAGNDTFAGINKTSETRTFRTDFTKPILYLDDIPDSTSTITTCEENITINVTCYDENIANISYSIHRTDTSAEEVANTTFNCGDNVTRTSPSGCGIEHIVRTYIYDNASNVNFTSDTYTISAYSAPSGGVEGGGGGPTELRKELGENCTSNDDCYSELCDLSEGSIYYGTCVETLCGNGVREEGENIVNCPEDFGIARVKLSPTIKYGGYFVIVSLLFFVVLGKEQRRKLGLDKMLKKINLKKLKKSKGGIRR